MRYCYYEKKDRRRVEPRAGFEPATYIVLLRKK